MARLIKGIIIAATVAVDLYGIGRGVWMLLSKQPTPAEGLSPVAWIGIFGLNLIAVAIFLWRESARHARRAPSNDQ